MWFIFGLMPCGHQTRKTDANYSVFNVSTNQYREKNQN